MKTIRDAVNLYQEIKAKSWNESLSDVINNTCLCFNVYTHNGTRCFIDMHPECEFTNRPEFMYQKPNKNGVFKGLRLKLLI